MKTQLVLIVAFLLFIIQHSPAQKVLRIGNDTCGMEGKTKQERLKKHRFSLPSADDFNENVTLTAMLKTGDDEHRWTISDAAQVVGYVVTVKDGDSESCNCKINKKTFFDTHIELVLDSTKTGKSKRVIVEVTPRLRVKKMVNGEDWTTAALKQKIFHHWVRVKGWMFYDEEHWNAAKNTNPDANNIWRATAWEIHPLTSIVVVATP